MPTAEQTMKNKEEDIRERKRQAGMIVRETREENDLDVLFPGGAQHAFHGLADHAFIQR